MNPLTPYLLWIKLGLVALLVASSSYGTWYVTSDHYRLQLQQQQNKWQQAYNTAVQSALDADQELLNIRKQAEAQHGKDQLVINSLSHQLDGVRIHIPTGGCAADSSGQAGSGANGGGGVLSERVDEAFADFQEETGRLIQRCDQLNIDAIQLSREIGQ